MTRSSAFAVTVNNPNMSSVSSSDGRFLEISKEQLEKEYSVRSKSNR